MCLLSLLGSTAATVTTPETKAAYQDVMTATTLATATLENLKALGGTRLPAVQQGPSHEGYMTMADFPMFRRLTTIAEHSPAPGLYTVTVTVFWERDTHAVRLSLILAE